MVCVGNSCRSPMAEAILKSMVSTDEGWYIDSAATADWNVGIGPEPRCLTVLGDHNLTSNHIGRQVLFCLILHVFNLLSYNRFLQITESDFNSFDYIFGMDDYNIADLRDLAPKGGFKAKIDLLGNYDYNETNIIHDPYFVSYIHTILNLYFLTKCDITGIWYGWIYSVLRTDFSKLPEFCGRSAECEKQLISQCADIKIL